MLIFVSGTIGNTLKIVFGTDGLNSILIDRFYYGGGSIEKLDFDTGTDVTLTTVSTIMQGDESNNTLNDGTANDNVEHCPVRWRVAA